MPPQAAKYPKKLGGLGRLSCTTGGRTPSRWTTGSSQVPPPSLALSGEAAKYPKKLGGLGRHWANLRNFVGFLGLASEPVQEGHVGEEAVLILRVADLGEHLLHVLLGDLVSQVAQDVVQLSEHHGAVLVFVVQLQQLHVVGVGSLAVGGLQGLF